MTKSDRANFGSKLGVILASAGSAVGLGNIWRFPFETGNHGGAAFILVYLVCVLILGIPIMIAEFLIGRRSRANTARAYQKLAPGTHWRWVGRMGVLAGFLILGYYSVVAGWTLEFIGEAATNSFAGKSAADFIASFNSFVSNPWRPVIWLVLFLLATHLIIEANYDEEMLKFGTYPAFLKERVASPTGHLSNREAAEFLAANYDPKLKDIWLCHLSRDNNHPELAYKTVDIRLFQEGVRVGKDVSLIALKRTTPSDIFEFE